jgi:hypothetical protein
MVELPGAKTKNNAVASIAGYSAKLKSIIVITQNKKPASVIFLKLVVQLPLESL